MTEEKIDFVIAWVDGGDPEWQAEFSKYKQSGTRRPEEDENEIFAQGAAETDTSAERYRDWDNLHYWFRGVEEFAPWVNCIHLITWGHLPEWLDTTHPKLNIANHRDFIPSEYLPTFNSGPIELNMHRIEGLSEKFVYFNDDMFLCRPADPERFFKKGLPRDIARLSVIRNEPIEHMALECVRVINYRHTKSKSVRKNLGKWFNRCYSAGDMFKTLTLMPWSFIPGFKGHHMPQPFLRSTFEKLWEEEFNELDSSCRQRFRTMSGLIQWVMRYEQLVMGHFVPHNYKDSRLEQISDDNIGDIAQMIAEQKYTMVCLNDNNAIRDFEQVKTRLNDAFESILSKKSGFEK